MVNSIDNFKELLKATRTAVNKVHSIPTEENKANALMHLESLDDSIVSMINSIIDIKVKPSNKNPMVTSTFIEDNEYFNLTVENITEADIDTIEDSIEFEATDIIGCLPLTLKELFEKENGQYYIKDEYSDEVSILDHSLDKLCKFLESKGYTFSLVDKIQDFSDLYC
tara:strand:+ start:375 stop:878 length:504 start_codon:yes stop_codon:yes gene_type:complete